MPFQFFPKEDYVLYSSHTPTELVDILSANIIDPRKRATSADSNNMESAYFEGEINKFNNLKFKISYNAPNYSFINKGSKPYPVNNGTITETKDGSSIHIITSWPAGLYLYITGILLFPVFLFVFSFPKVIIAFFLAFLIIFILLLRYQYMGVLKKDKEKIKVIFKGEY